MVLPDGRCMCDLDGCSSATPKQKIYVDSTGYCYCEYHDYLAPIEEELLEYTPEA